jgi:hypothetical protein
MFFPGSSLRICKGVGASASVGPPSPAGQLRSVVSLIFDGNAAPHLPVGGRWAIVTRLFAVGSSCAWQEERGVVLVTFVRRQLFGGQRRRGKEVSDGRIPYTTFLAQVRADNIASVYIVGEQITGIFRSRWCGPNPNHRRLRQRTQRHPPFPQRSDPTSQHHRLQPPTRPFA